MFNRCAICDATSTGEFSSNPFKPTKGTKFFCHPEKPHLEVCSNCYYVENNPQAVARDGVEPGEIELLEETY